MTEELQHYLKYQSTVLYIVDEFKKLNYSRRNHSFSLLVSWVGFPGEDTTEPLVRLYQDVPARVRDFLKSIENSDPNAVAALAKLATLDR